MLRKAIPVLIIAGFTVLVFYAYTILKDEVGNNRNPIEAVPTDAAIILESKEISSIWSRLSETNLVWSKLVEIEALANLDKKVRRIDSLLSTQSDLSNLIHRKSLVFSLHPGEQNATEFFAATTCTDEQYESIKKLITANVTLVKEGEICSAEKAEQTFYFKRHEPFVLLSSSQAHIQKSVDQLQNEDGLTLLQDSLFTQLRSTASPNAGLNCYVNFNELCALATPYLDKDLVNTWRDGKLFPEWAEFDLSLKPNALLLTGISTVDSKNEFLTSAANQTATNTAFNDFMPSDIKSVQRISVSDAEEFIRTNSVANHELLEERCQCEPVQQFSSWMGGEILVLEHGRSSGAKLYKTLVVETNGSENVLGRLSSLGVEDSLIKSVYGVEIYKVNNQEMMRLLGEQFQMEEPLYFAQNGHYALFSSMNGISRLSYQWKNESVLESRSAYFNYAARLMANYSTVDYYATVQSQLKKVKGLLNMSMHPTLDSIQHVLSGLGAFNWQTSPVGDHLQYHALAMNVQQSSEESNLLWSLGLKANVIREPELMKNHRTNTLEIAIQDENHVLHLISATGKIKWSKQLDGPILGGINQIDVYANGKWQMLFNTAQKIHLIDINGNQVKGYPIELNLPMTSPLAVFDYDKKKDYRILVASSNKRIYNFDKNGKTVEGWKFMLTDEMVMHAPEHHVMENKDYIMFTDLSGKTYFTDRKGNVRHSIENKVDISHDDFIVEKGYNLATSKYVYSDSLNRVCHLTFDDSLKYYVLDSTHSDLKVLFRDMDNDHLFKHIVSFDNRLEVYGPDRSLEFFENFDFQLNNGVTVVGEKGREQFIVVEDESTGQIYLYNSRYQTLPNFPAEGTHLVVVGDINKDGKVNVITIVNGNEVRTYAIEPFGTI